MLSIALYITLALVVMALLMNLYRLTVGPRPTRSSASAGHHVRKLHRTDCLAWPVAQQQNLLRVSPTDCHARFYQHGGRVQIHFTRGYYRMSPLNNEVPLCHC